MPPESARRSPAADFDEAAAYLRARAETGAPLPPEDARRLLDANACCLADLARVEGRAHSFTQGLWIAISSTLDPPAKMRHPYTPGRT